MMHPFKKLDRSIRPWVIAVMCLAILFIGSLAGIAYVNASKIHADCQVWYVVGDVPPTAGTSSLGLKIIASFRNAYVEQGCDIGRLDPANRSLYPYLDPDAR